jgi:uncharacterized cupredoxin-like copper-binding protein
MCMSASSSSLLRVVPVAALLLTLSTACGAATSGVSSAAGPTDAVIAADGAQSLTVSVDNSLEFTPRSIRVAAGQPIALTLRNGGILPHDFVLTSGVAQPVKVEAGPGGAGRGTFVIEHAGTYSFICWVPGHADGGMKGAITTQSPVASAPGLVPTCAGWDGNRDPRPHGWDPVHGQGHDRGLRAVIGVHGARHGLVGGREVRAVRRHIRGTRVD